MCVVSAKEGRGLPPHGLRQALRGARLPDDDHARPPALARHLGDFTRWKEREAYRQALERLLRDLKVEASRATDG